MRAAAEGLWPAKSRCCRLGRSVPARAALLFSGGRGRSFKPPARSAVWPRGRLGRQPLLRRPVAVSPASAARASLFAYWRCHRRRAREREREHPNCRPERGGCQAASAGFPTHLSSGRAPASAGRRQMATFLGQPALPGPVSAWRASSSSSCPAMRNCALA